MKTVKRLAVLLLALFLCMQTPAVSAEEDGDWFEKETEAVTTTRVATTAMTTLPTTTAAPSTTEKTVTLPAEVLPPIVRITRQDMTRKPAADEHFTVIVQIQNYSDLSLTQGKAVFEPGEGLLLDEKSDSLVVPPVAPRGIVRVELHLHVKKEYAATDVPVQISYAYSYRANEELVSATTEEKIMIVLKTPSSDDAAAKATPNIIVSKYDYGGTVSAGDSFSLLLEFTNTSTKLPAENIVMSIETGEGVSIAGASNAYYYGELKPGATLLQRVPMRVLTSASAQGVHVQITFRYEYVDGGTRSSASTNESLSIPVYIPDRFQLTRPDTVLIGVQNEELSVSVPYVNKGKSDVSNVQAELVFDESVVQCEQPRLNLGNFEPGKSGSIDFYFVPTEPGEGSVQVVVSYEDVLEKEKTLTIDVPYTVDAAFVEDMGEYDMEGMEEETEQPSTLKTILKFGIPAAAVVLIVVVIVVVRKRKKKKADPSVGFDWSFAQAEEQTHEDL